MRAAIKRIFHTLADLGRRRALGARACSLPYRRFAIGGASAAREISELATPRRLQACDTAQRGEAAIKLFGVRREVKRHAALAAWVGVEKVVSPLRSATAVQNRRRLRGFQAILID